MKKLLIQQRLLSLGGRFDITDESGQPVYEAQGSFLEIPKRFDLFQNGQVVASVSKKVFSWMPTFFVEVDGVEVATIKKEFTFFKPYYEVFSKEISVQGNFWDMDFEVVRNGERVGAIHKQWFKLRDTYEVEIYDEDEEKLMLMLVLSIDYVKQCEQSSAST